MATFAKKFNNDKFTEKTRPPTEVLAGKLAKWSDGIGDSRDKFIRVLEGKKGSPFEEVLVLISDALMNNDFRIDSERFASFIYGLIKQCSENNKKIDEWDLILRFIKASKGGILMCPDVAQTVYFWRVSNSSFHLKQLSSFFSPSNICKGKAGKQRAFPEAKNNEIFARMYVLIKRGKGPYAAAAMLIAQKILKSVNCKTCVLKYESCLKQFKEYMSDSEIDDAVDASLSI